jgi:hypothetical protein
MNSNGVAFAPRMREATVRQGRIHGPKPLNGIKLMKNRNIISIFTANLAALACLAGWPAPNASGVVPPPGGGYDGGNTALGTSALNNLVIPFRGQEGGERNTALGFQALLNLTTADDNTATGYQALFENVTGIRNTATGAGALSHNTASYNTANGYRALYSNTEGTGNTAVGWEALFDNSLGDDNTAVGWGALHGNGTGDGNTALGASALLSNSGSRNTAVGHNALLINFTGNDNTAIGHGALNGFLGGGVTGDGNTAIGSGALVGNTSGNYNTASGYEALRDNETGDFNTAIGQGALLVNTTGNVNTVLGFLAGSAVSTANNVICIGAAVGGQNVSDSCYIGNIFGRASGDGVPVFVNSNNKLGTATSSKRFKGEIKPIDKASVTLFSLKPVTFRYKHEIDPSGRSQFGLVAEDVEKVNPDLVVRDKEGKAYSVRYDQVNAMLLNEFLKEHRKVEELEATVARQQKDFQSKLAEQEKQMAALASGLQKVSAQIEISRPAPQVVKNDQ